MESIINAMNTLISNLQDIHAAIASQEEEAGDELAGLYEQMSASLELSIAIRNALKKAEATPQETAALIAETVRETLRPIGEEETDEQSKRQE